MTYKELKELTDEYCVLHTRYHGMVKLLSEYEDSTDPDDLEYVNKYKHRPSEIKIQLDDMKIRIIHAMLNEYTYTNNNGLTTRYRVDENVVFAFTKYVNHNGMEYPSELFYQHRFENTARNYVMEIIVVFDSNRGVGLNSVIRFEIRKYNPTIYS